MRYDLVIFDNDGVLVDSELIANTVLAGCLTEAGIPTTMEESIQDYLGSALHRVHEVVRERTGRELPADFDDTYHSRVFAGFEKDLLPVDGVAVVLEKLAGERAAYCLASSGDHERILRALGKTGLEARFSEERIFSAQDVGRGKPAPDLFLHAAASMGVPPGRCAVVEDSALGVQAALAAGMDVFGFTAVTPPAKLAGATALFGAMSDLPALLFA